MSVCIFSSENFKNTKYDCKSGCRCKDGKRPLSKWIVDLLFNGIAPKDGACWTCTKWFLAEMPQERLVYLESIDVGPIE